jgi:uncharacterized protein (TIGR02271 family)
MAAELLRPTTTADKEDRMTMEAQAPDQLFGYEVVDAAGSTIGKVDGVWVDDATNQLEFVSVKIGRLIGKTHIIPAAQAQVDGSGQTMTVPYDESQIKDAPSFGTDDELSPEDEDGIYSYYVIDRSTSASPTGLPTGGTGTAGTEYKESTSGDADSDRDATRDANRDQSLTLHEEELQVGKREVESGRVRLRKVVHTEHQEVPVELRREEVEIERVPATGDVSGGTAFEEQEITIPVTREEAVVTKESRATEQVRLNKTAETETEMVGQDVRTEDVEVDRDTGSELRDRRSDGL